MPSQSILINFNKIINLKFYYIFFIILKMKLLLLNYEYPPLGGGAGRAMQSIAKQLVEMGHDVDIITSHTKFSYSYILDGG